MVGKVLWIGAIKCILPFSVSGLYAMLESFRKQGVKACLWMKSMGEISFTGNVCCIIFPRMPKSKSI